MINIKWKENRYWPPYSDNQFESALKLTKELCSEFNLPRYSVGHNTLVSDLRGFGVVFKSNIKRHFYDLSPAWDFTKFKEEIEKK